jgi:hypothetical protein
MYIHLTTYQIYVNLRYIVITGRYNIYLDCIATVFVSNARAVALATKWKQGAKSKPQDHTNPQLMIWGARLNLTGEFVDILHRYTLFPKLKKDAKSFAKQLCKVSSYVLNPKKTKKDKTISAIYDSWTVRKDKETGENKALSGEYKPLLCMTKALGYGSTATSSKFLHTLLNLFFTNYFAFVHNVLFTTYDDEQFFEMPYLVASHNSQRRQRDNINFDHPKNGPIPMNDLTDLRIQNSKISNGTYNKKTRKWDGNGEIFRLVHIARTIFHSDNTSFGTHNMMSDQEKHNGKVNFKFDMDEDDVEIEQKDQPSNTKKRPVSTPIALENPAELSALATKTYDTIQKLFKAKKDQALTEDVQNTILSSLSFLKDAIITAATPKKGEHMNIEEKDLESTKTTLDFEGKTNDEKQSPTTYDVFTSDSSDNDDMDESDSEDNKSSNKDDAMVESENESDAENNHKYKKQRASQNKRNEDKSTSEEEFESE